MSRALAQACSRCRRECRETELVCGLCGNLLRREPIAAVASTPATPRPGPAAAPVATLAHRASRERWEPWIYLGLGALTAPVFALTPILGYMGWFLASLVHEMGHASIAWLCGMPSFPAISLDGHAAAMHGDQSKLLVIGIALTLAFFAWQKLGGWLRWVGLACAGLAYPVFAFSDFSEIAHLLGGHGGELLFATLALWKCLDGGFTNSRLERLLYGTVGWFLIARNLWLCWGLMMSRSARAHYHSNGSFGLTNDYIRVAEDQLNWRLESVALLMLLAALLVLPAALGLARVSRGIRGGA